jgi:uncharacterized membrane protein
VGFYSKPRQKGLKPFLPEPYFMAVYTPLDYAIGLAILFIIMWLTSKYLFNTLEFDKYFVYAVSPVIVFAIALRVLADAGVYEKNELWNVTPGIYVTATVFGIILIAVGKILERVKDVPYWKTSVGIGTPVAAYFSILLLQKMREPLLIFQPVLLALALAMSIYLLSGFIPKAQVFRGRENILIIFVHMLDGSATFIGIDKYGFSEEHLLPEFLIHAAGTAFVMIPLKILVVLGALYLLDKWKEEEEGSDLYYKMVKFVFFIFGFGPGTRDAILLAL